jgi:hypothetical protein
MTIPCIAQNKYNENLLHEHESVKEKKNDFQNSII